MKFSVMTDAVQSLNWPFSCLTSTYIIHAPLVIFLSCGHYKPLPSKVPVVYWELMYLPSWLKYVLPSTTESESIILNSVQFGTCWMRYLQTAQIIT